MQNKPKKIKYLKRLHILMLLVLVVLTIIIARKALADSINNPTVEIIDVFFKRFTDSALLLLNAGLNAYSIIKLNSMDKSREVAKAELRTIYEYASNRQVIDHDENILKEESKRGAE